MTTPRQSSDSIPSRVVSGLLQRIYRHRRAVGLFFYVVATFWAYAMAYLLRFDFSWPQPYISTFLRSLPVLLGLRLLFGFRFRVGSSRWRFAGTRDLVRLVAAASLGSAAFLLIARSALFTPVVPYSVVLLEWILNMAITGGTWLAYRLGFEHVRTRAVPASDRKRAIIVGAGEAGGSLVHEMIRYPSYRPVAFVDDDPMKWGSAIHGVEVVGAVRDLPAIARELDADELILAIPSASPRELRQIVAFCEASEIEFKLLPGIREVLEGRGMLEQVRPLEVEDLLGREPVELDLPHLRENLEGRVVLVTGAAGSIGSELCRQLALHGPERLVLLDQAETPLYYLELDLREQYPELDLVPVIGDVVDESAMEDLFRERRPDWIFHAAAYKHVPMMEENPLEAVKTNFAGTALAATMAGRYGAERFVLVSTDKAVSPSNMMGATKRLAELYVLQAQEQHPGTAYGAVRFGNVLGSAGSVIPVFRRQLQANRPLTITDPEVTRYFMTIAEAVQLILQASLLPSFQGRIAMLEMGEPVRILDLARNLLRLSGKPLRIGDTAVFTGLRPGEKLHESLVDIGEETEPTQVEKIRLISSERGSRPVDPARLNDWLESIHEGACDVVLEELRGIFPAVAGLAGLDAPMVALVPAD